MKDIINPWVIAGSILIASILIAVSFLAAGQLTPSDQSLPTVEMRLLLLYLCLPIHQLLCRLSQTFQLLLQQLNQQSVFI